MFKFLFPKAFKVVDFAEITKSFKTLANLLKMSWRTIDTSAREIFLFSVIFETSLIIASFYSWIKMDRLCVKCGGPGAIYRDNLSSDFFCSECYLESIKAKFRSALTKTRLFTDSWNPNKKPVRILVLAEKDSRLDAMLKLIDLIANEKEEKRKFRLDVEVCFLYLICSNVCLFRSMLWIQTKKQLVQKNFQQ